MARKRSRKNIVKSLDDLTRRIVLKRDEGVCQWCGKSVTGRDAQCSHVRSRKYYETRWALSNVKLLCASCHFKWHDNPLEAGKWFDKTFPARAEWILEQKRQSPKTWRDPDLLELESELKQKLKEIDE